MPRIKAHGLGGHVVNVGLRGRHHVGAAHPRHLQSDQGGGDFADRAFARRAGREAAGHRHDRAAPGPVSTNISDIEKLRPIKYQVDSPFRDRNLPHGALPDNPTGENYWLDPLLVGQWTVHAIVNNRLYLVTHPQFIESVKARHRGIEAAMAPGYLPD